MVENNNKIKIGELCIDKVRKNETNQSQSVNNLTLFGDNATSRKNISSQHHLIKNKLQTNQYGLRDGETATQNLNQNHQAQPQTKEATVIGVDHNSLNANSTIDLRACNKPEKKVNKSH